MNFIQYVGTYFYSILIAGFVLARLNEKYKLHDGITEVQWVVLWTIAELIPIIVIALFGIYLY